MKKVTVLSRINAKTLSFKKIPDCIIISINTNGIKNFFAKNENIKDILFLTFDDVEVDSKTEKCMTEVQAKEVVNFINKWDNIDNIIVHCDAGISRSSGVGAAILKAKNGDDSEIFDNGKFCPNMKCFRLVLEAFFIQIDEKEIKENIEKNLKAWRKAQFDMVWESLEN